MPGNPVWELDSALLERVSGLPDLNTYPVQREVLPGEWPPYYRPRGHWRALYRWESWGCLAVKGGEAHSSSFESMLDIMQSQTMIFHYGFGEQPQSVEMPVLDRFLFLENKFPGVVTLREALDEAELASQFQAAHLKRYGELARVPLPLRVHRLDNQLNQELAERLCRRLPERHHARVRALLPLGVLVYWYPTLPERVSHIRLPRQGRLQTLRQLLDPEATMNSWIQLVHRCLELGWMPCDPRSSLQGMCLEPQNLTLDGGMVDLDSLRPLRTFSDVNKAYERTIQVLARSLSEFSCQPPDLQQLRRQLHP